MIVLCHVLYVCACSQTLKCVYIIIYVMRKVRIRTILGFCCANLGSELCAIILGSRTQTSDPRILLRKPRIRTQSSRIAQPNPGHPRQQTHNRSRTQSSSAIRGNVGSLQRMAELLCVRDRSWLLCRGWQRFGCAIPEDCVRIRGLLACAIDRGFVAADGRGLAARSQKIACGSEFCAKLVIFLKMLRSKVKASFAHFVGVRRSFRALQFILTATEAAIATQKPR